MGWKAASSSSSSEAVSSDDDSSIIAGRRQACGGNCSINLSSSCANWSKSSSTSEEKEEEVSFMRGSVGAWDGNQARIQSKYGASNPKAPNAPVFWNQGPAWNPLPSNDMPRPSHERSTDGSSFCGVRRRFLANRVSRFRQ